MTLKRPKKRSPSALQIPAHHKAEFTRLLAAIRRHGDERTAITRKLRAQTLKDFARRDAAANRIQSMIQRKGMRALGLDADVLEIRRAKDHAAVERELERQEAMTQGHFTRMARRHQRMIRFVRASGKVFNWEGGNPVLTVCNWWAEAFEGSTEHSTNDHVLPLVLVPTANVGFGESAGNNAFLARIQIRSALGTSGSMTLLGRVIFVWEADRQGMMDAVAWVNALGNVSLTLTGGLCTVSPQASGTVTARLVLARTIGSVTSMVRGGDAVVLSPFERSRSWGGCTQQVSVGVASPDDTGDVELAVRDFPVEPGRLIVAAVEVRFRGEASGGGTVHVNFADGPRRVNVPSLWLVVNS